ncbi:HNH endonuclease [Bacillus spizizenii]|uniref:HNH endonuclease n=1 Tax=Bacillus spizizenii TaxID=96241 RepID=UPI00165A264A|nr:HNH endonuclease [Bacillus spizizenii]MEC1596022.1 HNH endonuclease [Bacillus spizizenii]MEC1641250.1 HNH endonuclease [Bacillus spizizenii]
MNDELIKIIKAENGAASSITFREATGDKSVTLDRFEKEVLKASYPDMDFPRKGGAEKAENSKEFKFYVHPYNDLENFNLRTVSIVYPKRKGFELRLYFSKASGFTIDSDTFNQKSSAEQNPYWYIFNRAEDEFPHIGMADLTFLTDYTLQFENDSILEREDADDTSYQATLQNELGKKRVLTNSSRFQRNIQESIQALKIANFTCEVDRSHKTFLSKASGKYYVEGHHLIPLSLQDQFELSIDIKENIVALCPICHRLLHHGTNDEIEKILFKLWSERKDRLLKRGIEVDTSTLLKYYLK